MKQKFNRRKFIKKSLLAGGAALTIGHVFPSVLKGSFSIASPDICSVRGTNFFESTIKSVEMLGGMEKFVSKGARVGILVNAPKWWKNPGSYTNTDVVLATAKMCLDAGASELVYLIELAPDFWDRSQLSKAHNNVIKQFRMHSNEYPEIAIEKGITLKKAKVIKDLAECDVFINIPIVKNHLGTRYTGCLKNMMGCCTSATNKFFHKGSGAEGEYDDIDFLSQCIADLNLVRQPDLNIADATIVLGSNGPWGPGELLTKNTIIAGANSVSVDSYAAGVLDLYANEINMINKASMHGLGEMNLSKLVIKEI